MWVVVLYLDIVIIVDQLTSYPKGRWIMLFDLKIFSDD